jgi:hypothetical protein
MSVSSVVVSVSVSWQYNLSWIVRCISIEQSLFCYTLHFNYALLRF